MKKRVSDPKGLPKRPSWREYQHQLKKPAKQVPRGHLVIAFSVLSAIMIGIYMGWPSTGATNVAPTTEQIEPLAAPPASISKKDVQVLLRRISPADLLAERVQMPFKGQSFTIETHLDEALQALLIDAMDLENSRYIGIVVMEPQSGRIRAMAGFDKNDPGANPCLRSTFPAASLFKIVTAAAAVDQCGYSDKTRVRFNGYKHTLYKNQLKEVNNRYTHTISFGASFAQSINPVFGKLGRLYLGKRTLEEYGLGFGFNQSLDFELPVAPSHLEVHDKPYHWAEIACGFNTETTVSPIHAAVMTGAVLNRGRMIPPALVECIVDPQGREIYRAHASWNRRAMTTRAATVLAEMMQKTIRSGTARKLFRGSTRDPILSHLIIGGKTGSIFNRGHDVRFDWFAGFAQEKDGPSQLVVAAMVAHEEFIGVRAGTYARKAMKHYFRNLSAQRDKKASRSNS